MSGSSSFQSASKLGDLLAQLPLNQAGQWLEIESTAQSLANALRIKDVEQQTGLGQTLLPQTLTSILKGATSDSKTPEDERKPAIYEILRVAANLCMDHDGNREALLEAGFPQAIVAILENYVEVVAESQTTPPPLSIPDLKIVKTAIGVLLNATLGYAPTREKLLSLDAPSVILKLAVAIYPPGSWLRTDSTEETAESWALRSGLSSWAWRAINELRGDDENARPFTHPDVIPSLVKSLHAFVPPYPSTPPPLFSTPTSRRPFIQADFESLEESCALLESLAMDAEDVRLSLARGFNFPEGEHNGVACLYDMLTFADQGDYSPYWSDPGLEHERAAKEKALDICKAAIIKAVVEVAGEEKSTDVLWDDSEPGKPGGVFVQKMVSWIRSHKDLKVSHRDDLLVCATLSLGNLVRRDAHAAAIINPPVSLGSDLAALLAPEVDIKVKHGVTGLLKHLAQSPSNRDALGKADVLQKLALSGVWSDRGDLVQVVQVSAIGIAKHMCTSNIENAFALVLPSSDNSSTPLKQIISLVQRSDSVAIKSEGTRVLVNVIKSLWAPPAGSSGPDYEAKRKQAMDAIVSPAHAAVLSQLIGRSRKYPLLINEGVVALTLLSTHGTDGAKYALDSLFNPLPLEATTRADRSNSLLSQPLSAGVALTTTGSGLGSAENSPIVGGPRRALDMLVSILRNRAGTLGSAPLNLSSPSSEAPPKIVAAAPNTLLNSTPRTPMEVRANLCALVGHLGRKGVVPEDRARDVQAMKDNFKDILEGLAKGAPDIVEGTKPGNLNVAAKKALDAWSA